MNSARFAQKDRFMRAGLKKKTCRRQNSLVLSRLKCSVESKQPKNTVWRDPQHPEPGFTGHNIQQPGNHHNGKPEPERIGEAVLIGFIDQGGRLAVKRQDVHMFNHKSNRQRQTYYTESESIGNAYGDGNKDHRPHGF